MPSECCSTNRLAAINHSVINVNVLVFEKFVHRRQTVQTAVAAPFEAAFFKFIPNNRPVVDPNRSGVNFARYSERTIQPPRSGTCSVSRLLRTLLPGRFPFSSERNTDIAESVRRLVGFDSRRLHLELVGIEAACG